MVSKIEGYTPDVGLLFLIALLFFLALRSSKKRRPVFEELPMVSYGGTLSASELDTGQLPAVSPLGVPTLTSAGSPVNGEVEAYISTSPDEVAQLMRSWSQERPARSGS